MMLSAAALACLLTAVGCSSSSDSSTPSSSGSSAAGGTSSSFDAIVSKGKDEGTVVIYTVAQQAQLDLLTAAFAKDYPKIKLSVFHGNTGQVITKLKSEQDAGKPVADLVITNKDAPTSTIETYDTEGKLATPVGPNLAAPDFKAAMTGNHFWVFSLVFGWAWNTQLLPNGIHSWSDFLSKDLSGGKLAVFDPSVSSIIPACYQNQIAASGNSNFLAGLGSQNPRIYPGGQAEENAVASGEVAATAFASKRVLQLKQQGAPIDFAVPDKGACVSGVQGAILKNAPHPNAAQVFANWLASDAGQESFMGSGTPAKSNVPGNDVDFASLVPTTPVTPAEQQTFIADFKKVVH